MCWVKSLNGENLSRYSNKIESVSRPTRKSSYGHWFTNKAYLSAIMVTNISKSFTYKMVTKINWNKITSPMYTFLKKFRRRAVIPQTKKLDLPNFENVVASLHRERKCVEIIINNIIIYTVSQKTRHLTLAHNLTEYWPIFKILSLLYSAGSL